MRQENADRAAKILEDSGFGAVRHLVNATGYPHSLSQYSKRCNVLRDGPGLPMKLGT